MGDGGLSLIFALGSFAAPVVFVLVLAWIVETLGLFEDEEG